MFSVRGLLLKPLRSPKEAAQKLAAMLHAKAEEVLEARARSGKSMRPSTQLA